MSDPTDEQIAERCLEVQREWDQRMRERRLVGKPARYRIPLVRAPDYAEDWYTCEDTDARLARGND